MKGCSCRCGEACANLHYSAAGKFSMFRGEKTGKKIALKNLLNGLRRVREQTNIGMTFGVESVVHRVRTVSEGHKHVHGLMSVFGGADQKASCAGEVQNWFVLAGGSAASRQIAELVVAWCGLLRRGFLPQAGVDKNNRAILV